MAGTDVARYDGPNSPEARWKYAESLAGAGLLPDAFRRQPANVFYAVEYGRALDISPIAALAGIHVIEGKPSASSGLICALVRRAGHRLRVRVTGSVTGGDITATCEIVRSDDPDFTFAATWDLQRALRSGLIQRLDVDQAGRCVIVAKTPKGKPSSWEKFPEAMLKARAITEAAREACEEALSGLHYTPEELGAQVDEDENVIQGEVIDDQPAAQQPPQGEQQAHRGRPASPDLGPGEQAAMVAKLALQCADLDVLRRTWAEADGRGLLDVDATASLTGEQLRELAPEGTAPVPLRLVLKGCAEAVEASGMSVVQLLAQPVPDTAAASAEAAPGATTAEAIVRAALNEHTVGDPTDAAGAPTLTGLLKEAQAAQVMNDDARPWLTPAIAHVLQLGDSSQPIPVGVVLHAVRKHLTTGDGTSAAEAAAQLTHA